MKKLGILLDSFHGLKKKQIEEAGFQMVSENIIIDGKLYKEGEDITYENAKKILIKAKDIKSSMPPIGIVSDIMKEMLEKYENVFYLPMNKGMSSAYAMGVTAANEFKNVHVIDHHMIGTGILNHGKTAIQLADDGKDIKEIIEELKKRDKDSITYIMIQNTENMVKSGRIQGTLKALFAKIKIIPRYEVTEDGLKLSSTRRSYKKQALATAKRIVDKIDIKHIDDYSFVIVSTGSKENDTLLMGALQINGAKDVKISPCPIAAAAYAGIGANGITVFKK